MSILEKLTGMKWFARNRFKNATKTSGCYILEGEVQRSLNYVWINKEPFESTDDEMCGIPLKYLDKAIQNANRYPDTSVNIWIDFNLLDQSSLFFAAAHAYLFADQPSNIQIRNLRDIPAYRDDEIFGKNVEEHNNVWVGGDMWARVDYARLLVLQHVLAEDNDTDVFYADFDVEDVKIDTPFARSSMSHFGLLIGALKQGGIENGFLGVRSNEPTGFLDKLVIETHQKAQRHLNGFSVYTSAVSGWEKQTKVHPENVMHQVLERVGHIIKDVAIYQETGINQQSAFR